jgi:hypothetical protein
VQPAAIMAHAVDFASSGLSPEEFQMLQQGQSAVAQAGSTSSRAASRASSQGMLLLDPSSLAQLGRHFDRTMQQIQQQLDFLAQQCEVVTMTIYDEAGQLIDNCDAEIARYHHIMAQLEELETDFDRIRHIRDIVRDFKHRAEQMEKDLERSQTSSSRHRDHDRDRDRHKHHHGHSKKDSKKR